MTHRGKRRMLRYYAPSRTADHGGWLCPHKFNALNFPGVHGEDRIMTLPANSRALVCSCGQSGIRVRLLAGLFVGRRAAPWKHATRRPAY